MSSDWNEPGSTWQEPSHANWTQSPDSQHMEDDYPIQDQQEKYAFDPDAQNMLDTSFSPEQELFPDNQETDEGEEGDTGASVDPIAKPTSFLKQLWYYVTLIVFPFLFFGIAGLLILPKIAASHGLLIFWFVAVVLLIIAVGQGVAVYFSGQENHMWVLGTLGGLLLFILMGVFLLNPWAGLVLLVIILASSVYLARRCIHPVADGTVDIVSVSGNYTRTLFPGFNFIWPWEALLNKEPVNIKETYLMQDKLRFQLSPEEDVILGAVMFYQVAPEDAYLAITQVKDWQKSLSELFVATLQTVATHFVPTDFLAWSQSLQAYKARTQQTQHDDPESAYLSDESEDQFTGGVSRRKRINTLLFHEIRDRVAPWGIQINWVRIQYIELAPHTLARISAPATLSSYTAEANDNQTEKELVGVSSASQTNRVQSPDSRDSDSAGRSGERISIDQEITQALKEKANPNTAPALPSQKLPTEETMRKAYEQVQNGKVTDPQAIRQIAMTFEAAARDPEVSQKISFDIERAVTNLRKQAEQYEEIYRSGQL